MPRIEISDQYRVVAAGTVVLSHDSGEPTAVECDDLDDEFATRSR